MYTALHHSCSNDHTQVSEFLLDNKADIDARNGCGYTPLHICNFMNTCKLLVQRRADLTARGNDGTTPLKRAIQVKKSDIVAYLRSVGAPE